MQKTDKIFLSFSMVWVKNVPFVLFLFICKFKKHLIVLYCKLSVHQESILAGSNKGQELEGPCMQVFWQELQKIYLQGLARSCLNMCHAKICKDLQIPTTCWALPNYLARMDLGTAYKIFLISFFEF